MTVDFKRWSGLVVVGTCMTLAACGRGNDAGRDSATSSGDVAMTDTGNAAARAADTGMKVTGSDTGAAYNGAGGANADANIMAQITTANTSEIEQGKLAEQRATSAKVKQFARMMVTDHSAMNKQGHEVASKMNATTKADDKANDMNKDASNATRDLRAKSGADFDKAYMSAQVDAHQKALDLLNDASKNAKDAQLTTMIHAAIPKVQSHLDRAKQIQQSLGT